MGSSEATAGLEREGSGATCTGAPAREGVHQWKHCGIQPRTRAQGRGRDDFSTTGGDLSQSDSQGCDSTWPLREQSQSVVGRSSGAGRGEGGSQGRIGRVAIGGRKVIGCGPFTSWRPRRRGRGSQSVVGRSSGAGSSPCRARRPTPRSQSVVGRSSGAGASRCAQDDRPRSSRNRWSECHRCGHWYPCMWCTGGGSRSAVGVSSGAVRASVQ